MQLELFFRDLIGVTLLLLQLQFLVAIVVLFVLPLYFRTKSSTSRMLFPRAIFVYNASDLLRLNSDSFVFFRNKSLAIVTLPLASIAVRKFDLFCERLQSVSEVTRDTMFVSFERHLGYYNYSDVMPQELALYSWKRLLSSRQYFVLLTRIHFDESSKKLWTFQERPLGTRIIQFSLNLPINGDSLGKPHIDLDVSSHNGARMHFKCSLNDGIYVCNRGNKLAWFDTKFGRWREIKLESEILLAKYSFGRLITLQKSGVLTTLRSDGVVLNEWSIRLKKSFGKISALDILDDRYLILGMRLAFWNIEVYSIEAGKIIKRSSLHDFRGVRDLVSIGGNRVLSYGVSGDIFIYTLPDCPKG